MPKVEQQQIDAWKAKHGRIFKMEAEGKEAYLRFPQRKDLSYASAGSKGDAMAMSDLLVKACWLEGDEEFKTEIEYSLALSAKFMDVVKVKEGELKEL